jgi:hypothetical protein
MDRLDEEAVAGGFVSALSEANATARWSHRRLLKYGTVSKRRKGKKALRVRDEEAHAT